MENVILNGELYIKKKPKIETKIITNPNAIPEVFDINGNVIEDFDFTNPEHLKLLPASVLNMFESIGAIKRIERTNYEDNVGFYQMILDQNGFYLLNKRFKNIYRYKTKEELENEFISLIDFIHHALFIGRYLEPIDIPLSKFVLVYEYDGIYLLKDLENNKYFPISKDHPLQEHFKIGEILPEYYEKEELIKAIVNQEIKPNDLRKM